MTPVPHPTCPAAPAVDTFSDAAAEHVLRVSPEPSDAWAFLPATPAAAGAQVAVGRLLGRLPGLRLPPGTPLAVAACGGTLTPAWRDLVPPHPESAWAQLRFLLDLYQPGRDLPVAGAQEALQLWSLLARRWETELPCR